MSSNKVKIGVDLGTTNSCVAFYKMNKVEIVDSNSSSQKNVIPTCISFSSKNDKIKYGDAALNSRNQEFTLITNAKRFIGKKYSDINPDILKFYPFVKRGKDDDVLFEVEYNKNLHYFSPMEITSLFLKNINQIVIPKVRTTDVINSETHAVICIPAVFQYSQREATKQAAEKAGIKVDELLPEATAAALAYCHSNEIDKDKCNILVYDFGGGTFDVSIVHVEDNVLSIIATEGDSELGGEDITNRIVEYLINEIRKKKKDFMKGYEYDNKPEDGGEESKTESKEEKEERMKLNRKYLKRIRQRSEIAKISLSTVDETQIDEISEEITKIFGDINFNKSKFENLCEDIFQNTLNTVKTILSHCNLKAGDIDYIVLAGGSSRIPRIKKLLNDYFVGKKICQSINPDEAIAYGAAVYSSKDEMELKFTLGEWDKKYPFSFGIDLGTTFSCTAYYNYSVNNTRVIAPISGGKQSIPSIIAFEKKGDKILYGKAANNVLPTKYTIISDAKRYIGKDYGELDEEILKSKSYKIVNNDGIKYKVEYNNKIIYYSPKDISSMILKHIRTESIPTIPGTGTDTPTKKYPIVLTVPADFSFIHREQTIAAAEEAGFTVTALINEPTAAALAYIEKNNDLINKNPFNLLVYDFGGGTFDVSIVRIESIQGSKCKKMKVIWTDGINNLGGQDLTMELIKYIKVNASNEFGNKVNLNDEKAIRRIEKIAEEIKIALTSSENHRISLDINKNSYEEDINRSAFENMIRPYITQTIEKVKESISSSKLNINDINAFVLTGGSSHIPLVNKMLSETFNKPIEHSINPDEAVAIGACLYAKNKADEKVEHHQIVDVLSHSLGMEIRRVLRGNSIQRMLNRMSELPCEQSTQVPSERGVGLIKIYEGESDIPSKNYFLGESKVRVPFNESKIDVSFKANTNGNLEIYVKVDGVYQRIKNSIFKIR